MDYYIHDNCKLSTAELHALVPRLESLAEPNHLATILGIPMGQLNRLVEKPKYFSFHIPKPGGKKRFIQTPEPKLKAVQHKLNRLLQAAYHQIKPDCAYGFIIRPMDEMVPRNIYFNALRHQKGQYFLNIDIRDFFHQITRRHLGKLWEFPFCYPPALAELLVKITTYQGRLPMGAPTSPVLSNFVCLGLDFQLENLAKAHQVTYTRYADDLTFSFQGVPSDDFILAVEQILLQHDFLINAEKTRLQKRADKPEITGLIIGKGTRPTLSKQWLKRLKKELRIYDYLMSAAVMERGLFQAYVFDRYRKSLTGQIAFVGMVEGKESRLYRKLVAKLRLSR